MLEMKDDGCLGAQEGFEIPDAVRARLLAGTVTIESLRDRGREGLGWTTMIDKLTEAPRLRKILELRHGPVLVSERNDDAF